MDFQIIYKKYYRQILHYSNKILSANQVIYHYELAEDLTQESFVAAYERWDTFETELNIKHFLFLCVQNKTYNKLSELKRREKDHKAILHLSSDVELPDYLAMNSDIIGFILEQLENLPPVCGVIVKLYFKGLTSHEIAAKLHITRKTALNQKLKGIGLLKQKLLLKYG